MNASNRYLPHTDEDVQSMLGDIGLDTEADLFATIPDALQLGRELDLPSASSEPDLMRDLQALAAENAHVSSWASFLGAGSYHHFIPAFIWQLVGRGEFLTPYTPYQPEISQGTLQVIFEYQSMMCELFALDVANASNYDLSTAVTEAILMAMRVTKRDHYVVAENVHPEYRAVADSVLLCSDRFTAASLPLTADGLVDHSALAERLNADTACVVAQYPSFLGTIEDLRPIADQVHEAGALLVVAVPDPIALGLLEAPGNMGADIVVAEGQPLGNPPNYGGPYVGIFATRQKYVRQMPGRIAGATVDGEDRRGFVLTLSTREQHIRRAKATSNICTNQQLCALAATMYTAWLGRDGLQKLAQLNFDKAQYAKTQLAQLPGVTLPYAAPSFHEFVLRTKKPASAVLAELKAEKIFGGIALSRWNADAAHDILVCVTEQNTRDQIDRFVHAMKAATS